ncbi:MAG: hypothetical protein IPL01_24235 [Acidobacteria bacterium]|nr:hypothetical protein [Acidobacteriota bacterium]MBK8316949.1 hypothetical protein [Acidobacteriota bacterium]MBK9709340.1 hypothetical protein [Acidobacteriota bacterium]
MFRRQITEEQVAFVLAYPEQSEPVRIGRTVYQSRLDIGEKNLESYLRPRNRHTDRYLLRKSGRGER